MERKTGFEPATPTLARLYSTTELLPHDFIIIDKTPKNKGLSSFLGVLTWVSHEGLEPSTLWLKVRCSTDWANGSYKWCRQEDLNPQPTDYKSVALPIELHRHGKCRLFHCVKKSWWRMTGSNRRPSACKADALPAELIARQVHSCYEIIECSSVDDFLIDV